MGVVLFLLIIAIIIVYNYNGRKTREENEKLRKELEELKKGKTENTVYSENSNSSEPKMEEQVDSKYEKVQFSSHLYQRTYKDTERVIVREAKDNEQAKRVVTKEEKEFNSEVTKNICILTLGSVFIVLAAIVFLASTWAFLSNVAKIITIALLIPVFLGMSAMAEKKYNLKNTSKAFFYIAMAYIPISLMACGAFELFGNYFSLHGEGSKIFLSAVGLIVSAVYYMAYLNKKDKLFLYGSAVIQFLTVYCILTIFDFKNTDLITLTVLMLFNALQMISLYKIDKKYVSTFNTIVYYVLAFSAFLSLFISISWWGLAAIAAIMVNAICFVRLNIHLKGNYSIFTLCFYILGYYVIYKINPNNLFESNTVAFITAYIYSIIIGVVSRVLLKGMKIENKEFFDISVNTNLVILGVLSFTSLYIPFAIIRPWMFLILYTAMLFENYRANKGNVPPLAGFFIPITLIFGISQLMMELPITFCYRWLIIISIITFIIGELFKGRENYRKLNLAFFIVSHVAIVLAVICSFEFEKVLILKNPLYFIALCVIYMYSYIKNRKMYLFKYLLYISTGFLVNSFVSLFDFYFKFLSEDISAILISSVTFLSAIVGEGKLFKKFKDLNSYIALGVIGTVTFFILYASSLTISSIIMIIFTCLLTYLSVNKGKASIYTLLSFVFMIGTYKEFDFGMLGKVFLLLWAAVSIFFIKTKNVNLLIKEFAFIVTYALIYDVIKYLALDSYISISSIALLLLMIVSIKYVLSELVKEKRTVEAIEYIGFAIVELRFLDSYQAENVFDGMVFLFFLVALLIYSYMKKYGSTFMGSLVLIIINLLFLTKEFWVSVPWWIYLFVVGVILVAFAINNESKAVNGKAITHFIRNIKRKIEEGDIEENVNVVSSDNKENNDNNNE